MKPRLIFVRKLWYCGAPETFYGIGYTAGTAYANWLSMNPMRTIDAHKVGA